MSCLMINNAFANILILGQTNGISQSLVDKNKQTSIFSNEQVIHNNIVYINLGTASESEVHQAATEIANGTTVVIDLTEIIGDNERINLSQKMTGLGISAPVVVTGTYQGESFVNAIITDVTDNNGDPINDPQTEVQSIKTSLMHVLNRLEFGEE